jgi:allophanate hydrolase subunit 1
MTTVQIQYDLTRPLDETLMARIAAAHALYGISRIQLGPSFDSLTVEYDASRLTANEVEAALYRFGIPLAQRC